ncbi:hypothetical protein ABZR56_12415 [Pseudomonas aeruginosa]
MTESKICTCPSGDGSLRRPCPKHPAVEQAGGDERAAFEVWIHTFDLPPQLDGEIFADERYPEADCFGQFVYDDHSTQRCWAAWQARAALAQPSPALPPFAEKVLAKLRRFYDCASDFESGGVDIGRRWLDLLTQLGLLNRVQRSPALWEISQQGEDLLGMPQPSPAQAEQAEAERPEVVGVRYEDGTILSAEDCGIALEVCARVQTPLMTVAQHERIVEARWNRAMDLLLDHVSRISEKFKAERDAALARVAELELGIARIAGDFLPDNSGQAELALDEMRQALHELLAAAPTQAQHSVPEKVRTLLSRAQCEIEHLPECLENVCEDEEDFDVREDVADGRVVAADIAHMLAAAPDKKVPQAWLDVQAERRRQVEAEGWTPEHDDEHADGQMAQAAGCYALHAGGIGTDWPDGRQNGSALFWPWDKDSWKPTTPRRDLVKACALALAEIERLDRAGISQSPQPGATTASS